MSSDQPTTSPSKDDKLKATVLKSFFTEQGSLKHLPSQLKKKLIVLEYLATKLDPAHKYTEREINDFIKPINADYATIRRELFIHKFVNRNNEIYELNEPREWRDWRTLR